MTQSIPRFVLDAKPVDYKVRASTEGNIEITIDKSPSGVVFPKNVATPVDLKTRFTVEFPGPAKPTVATDRLGAYPLWLFFSKEMADLGLICTSEPLLGKTTLSSSVPPPASLGKILFTVLNPTANDITVPHGTMVARGMLVSRLPIEVKSPA